MELITDGVHIHPAMVRFTFRTFGDSHVILVADSMMACGLPDGQYSLGGQAVTVCGPRATLTEHPDTIAGSATCLYDCMRHAVLDMGRAAGQRRAGRQPEPGAQHRHRRGLRQPGTGPLGQRGAGRRAAQHPEGHPPRQSAGLTNRIRTFVKISQQKACKLYIFLL